MKAEVVAVGDELTSGVCLDTNSRWLGLRLGEMGIPVQHHTTVGDDLEAIADVLRNAMDRANVVITSGGIGPTADDLTRHALAAASGHSLALNHDVLAQIRALFKRRGRVMPQQNAVQAQFPAGSRVIANPNGTAPGIHMEVVRNDGQAVDVFALPGVPAEMHQMWSESVAPILADALGPDRRYIVRRLIHCFGIGESDVERLLPDLIRRGREPSVGITASQATITLRVTAKGATLEECQGALERTAATIYACLGQLVFGEGDDQLQDVVVRMLLEQRLTLATSEWGTGGLVSAWLTETEGGAACVRGGVVVRDAQGIANVLDVPADTRSETPNDPSVVAAMAKAIRQRFESDLGLAVGPFPQGSDGTGPPDQFHVALSLSDRVRRESMVFAAHPAIQRQRSAKQALNLVRLHLLEMP